MDEGTLLAWSVFGARLAAVRPEKLWMLLAALAEIVEAEELIAEFGWPVAESDEGFQGRISN